MATVNMKKVISLTLSIFLGLSIANAAPLKKPSPAQIKKLIKQKMIKKKTLIAALGTNSSRKSKCEDMHINKIKILKIGRSGSTYYKYSGEYINSSFMVKFLIQGSCNITPAYRINDSEYSDYMRGFRRYSRVYEDGTHLGNKKPIPVMPMDLKGKIPFRSNIPLETSFFTDSYGDWTTSGLPGIVNPKENNYYSDKTKKYLIALFNKKNTSNIKKWEREQVIAKNKMSDDAESGLHVIIFNKIYTSEFKALLQSQPKSVKDYILKTYWKINLHNRNHVKSDQFLRETLRLMRSKARKSNQPRKSSNTSSSNSHSHGGRRHTHKLPHQGKAHRHGNGAVGH